MAFQPNSNSDRIQVHKLVSRVVFPIIVIVDINFERYFQCGTWRPENLTQGGESHLTTLRSVTVIHSIHLIRAVIARTFDSYYNCTSTQP